MPRPGWGSELLVRFIASNLYVMGQQDTQRKTLLLLKCKTCRGVLYFASSHVININFLLLTGKSFLELVRYIFKMPDVKSFLSQRICQDPLENFFGQQRQRGGIHDNPNVKEFIHNTQALRVAQKVRIKRGNCRGSVVEISVKENSKPLPKRARKPAKPLGLY